MGQLSQQQVKRKLHVVKLQVSDISQVLNEWIVLPVPEVRVGTDHTATIVPWTFVFLWFVPLVDQCHGLQGQQMHRNIPHARSHSGCTLRSQFPITQKYTGFQYLNGTFLIVARGGCTQYLTLTETLSSRTSAGCWRISSTSATWRRSFALFFRVFVFFSGCSKEVLKWIPIGWTLLLPVTFLFFC